MVHHPIVEHHVAERPNASDDSDDVEPARSAQTDVCHPRWFVVRDLDGTAKSDDQADKAIARICRRAGLPVRLFHTLRHTFGTHAALFGVNPWRLQAWLGHKRIDETMLYVHVAEAHPRELPEQVQQAACTESDPDRRILAMLSARGKTVAKTQAIEIETKRSA